MKPWSVTPTTSMPAASSRCLACSRSSHRADVERQVVHPRGSIRRRIAGEVVAEVEERDERAVAHLEEDVDIGTVFAGRRHVVFLDDVRERQPQDVLVELAGLLRIAAAVREMVQSAHRHESLPSALRSPFMTGLSSSHRWTGFCREATGHNYATICGADRCDSGSNGERTGATRKRRTVRCASMAALLPLLLLNRRRALPVWPDACSPLVRPMLTKR